jgi:DNA-binding phage protein
MPPIRKFEELMHKRIARDPGLRDALLREVVGTKLSGEFDIGKAILRDHIKVTVGFEKVAEATGTPPKSLIRLLGPRGNPPASNLFGIIGHLQKQAGTHWNVASGPG